MANQNSDAVLSQFTQAVEKEAIDASKKLRVGIIGTGGIAHAHMASYLKMPDVELVAAAEIIPGRAEAFFEEFGVKGVHIYADYKEMLDKEQLDAVSVCTYNRQHACCTIAALEHGVNVLLEKPMCVTLDEAVEVCRAEKKSGKILSIGFQPRVDVNMQMIKKIVESGELGKIINIESRIHGSRGIPSDWRGEREHGGGMLYDWGIHLIDQLMQLFPGKVERVYCTFDHITNKEVDDGFKLTLYFDDGTEAYCEVGTYNFIAMPRFYMRAEKGTALISDWREETEVVKCKYWHESDVIPVETAAGLTKTMAPRDEITTDTYRIPRPKSDVHDYYRNFVAAIDGKTTQLVTHEQMLRDLEIVEAAFRSVEEGNVVRVSI